jgi:heme exporter protein A
MGPVIELRSVSKTYGAVRALVGVSCRFEAGRATVVRGPNGSGKSTLLAIVGTLSKATSGVVDHGGLGRSRDAIRRRLGWVGHESLCYPDLTGRENIELAARLHGENVKDAFNRAAARFDLTAFADRAVRTYSRVHRPRLLLLDEPTTGLDAAATARLVGVVKEEVAGGAAMVVVTHDAAFAEALEAHTIALERGRVVARD